MKDCYDSEYIWRLTMKTVRTRVAPSPTGDPHVGTAYIALFNYCFAKQHGGEFILRIEDTDQVRSTKESEDAILNSLKWLGLSWDQEPCRQSDRKDIYKQHAQILVDKGHAFPCFCDSHRLDKMREVQIAAGLSPKYDGHCLNLSPEDVASKLNAGVSHVIRMKVPTDGVCTVNDMLRGVVTYDWKQVDMQVLMKQDGLPTYFLANVVDDHLMDITHVLKGEEWLPSAPKLVLLYQYFGWDMPEHAHMPLLRNADRSKLSKRKNPTSITFYKDMGYLPEALLNYLGRMGWSMPDEREKFTLQEMVDNFDIQRVSLGGPVFDVNKLSWLNGLWLRELSPNDFKEKLSQWALANDKFDKLVPMIQSRVENFSQVNDLVAFMYSGDLRYDTNLFNHKKLSDNEVKESVQVMLWDLEALKKWNETEILDTLKASAAKLNLKLKDIMPLVFGIITGSLNSISVIDAMSLLGPDMTRYRFRTVLGKLGGFTEQELDNLIQKYK